MLTFTKEQIKEISEQLDCGFRAFYHKQNGELIFVPNEDKFDSMDTDAWQEEQDKLDANFTDYQEVDAMDSNESFRVMADFAEQITDRKLQGELIHALEKKKPFREFKFVIDNSGEYRQHWFDYKNKRQFEWTEEQLNLKSSSDDEEN